MCTDSDPQLPAANHKASRNATECQASHPTKPKWGKGYGHLSAPDRRVLANYIEASKVFIIAVAACAK